jgi:hypothetical protein
MSQHRQNYIPQRQPRARSRAWAWVGAATLGAVLGTMLAWMPK